MAIHILSLAYWATLDGSGLKALIEEEVNDLHCGKKSLSEVGNNLRRAVASAPLPQELQEVRYSNTLSDQFESHVTDSISFFLYIGNLFVLSRPSKKMWRERSRCCCSEFSNS
jgi:hypothetical protein